MMEELLQAFFPSGLLNYFEVSKYDLNDVGYMFELREKNIAPSGYKKEDLESKGFYEGGDITDFPLRGKRCVYKVYRRKWIVKQTGKVIVRDWDIVARGTRITEEFATFLKGINRYHPS